MGEDSTPLERRLEARIWQQYDLLGAGMGWRLLYSPTRVLLGSEVAFIALNPGGSARTDRGTFAVPGSAYVDESWAGYPPGQSPLQRQVRLLFSSVGIEPQKVLAGNLVPYHSPSWKALPRPKEAIAFGRSVWAEIIESAQPNLIICVGAETWRAVSLLVAATPPTRIPLGWGAVNGMRASFPRGRIIGLPHLSRFRVFGRTKSEAGLRALLNG